MKKVINVLGENPIVVLAVFLIGVFMFTSCGGGIDPHNFEESVKEVGSELESEEKKRKFEAHLGFGLMTCRAEIGNELGIDHSQAQRRFDTDSDGGFGDDYADLIEEHCPYIAGQDAEGILDMENHPEWPE